MAYFDEFNNDKKLNFLAKFKGDLKRTCRMSQIEPDSFMYRANRIKKKISISFKYSIFCFFKKIKK